MTGWLVDGKQRVEDRRRWWGFRRGTRSIFGCWFAGRDDGTTRKQQGKAGRSLDQLEDRWTI